MIVSAGIPIRPWLSDDFSGMRNHAGIDKAKKSSAEGGKIFRKQAVPARRADRRIARAARDLRSRGGRRDSDLRRDA